MPLSEVRAPVAAFLLKGMKGHVKSWSMGLRETFAVKIQNAFVYADTCRADLSCKVQSVQICATGKCHIGLPIFKAFVNIADDIVICLSL